MKITDELVERATAAVCARYQAMVGLTPPAIKVHSIRSDARAAVEAVAPLIAAQALRDYADGAHPHAVGHARRVEYGTGIEHDTECGGCGSSWSETEGGCTERVELIRAANALIAPPGPDCNCHETGAPCSCAAPSGGPTGGTPND